MGLADWDWGYTNHSLDSTDYVEGTSSLRMFSEEANLCKISGVTYVPHGAIETYHKSDLIDYWFGVIFRNSSPLGSFALSNCYEFRIRPYYVESRLAKYVDTTEKVVSEGKVWGLDKNIWQRIRIVWYVKDGKLYAYAEKLNTKWEKITHILFDEEPSWGDRTLERCGIWVRTTGYTLWDSTGIYTVTP